ncbi:hypothetical protein A6E01_07970 [Vibrio breoganii]|uniref:Uncharacterized protein n=1 Tax=Vibrio breoganii TaxID=553239 RepID=A0AAN0XV09_9VIBR|nr:hypothetical protein A6E01_07970 [Vibrio breoganii]
MNGERDRYREAEFASRWEDIYLGSQEDQVPVAELSLSTRSDEISDQSHYAFKYNAPQGEFELAIPKVETEVLQSDTTIELLVNFFADEVNKDLSTAQTLKVVAYEGVGKGAVAFR